MNIIKKYKLPIALLLFSSAVAYVLLEKKYLFETNEIVPLTKSWEKVVPHQAIPMGLVSLKSEDCGTCHTAHYEEWKLSTHAHAWTDLQFQAELKKESSPFLCVNCHIPLQNQQEFIISGMINGDIYKPVKKKNPFFDKSLQQEGINCASCHVRNGAIIGTNENLNAPHKVKKDPIFLSEKLCISCHNANAVVTPTLACTFETGDEWEKGPFFGKKNCVTCHMPETQRSLVAGYPKRKSHAHFFTGSGIPKFDSVKTTVFNGLSFEPSNMKSSYKLADSLIYNLKVKNEFAGHRVPSGDPERFILIKMELFDEKGKVVNQKIERIGEKWQWYPVAKKLADNNMNPSEVRNYSFAALLKDKSKLKLKIEVTKHRMDEKTAAYNKLGKNYPLFISIYKKEYSIRVK